VNLDDARGPFFVASENVETQNWERAIHNRALSGQFCAAIGQASEKRNRPKRAPKKLRFYRVPQIRAFVSKYRASEKQPEKGGSQLSMAFEDQGFCTEGGKSAPWQLWPRSEKGFGIEFGEGV
jgi:hypothetical protein